MTSDVSDCSGLRRSYFSRLISLHAHLQANWEDRLGHYQQQWVILLAGSPCMGWSMTWLVCTPSPWASHRDAM